MRKIGVIGTFGVGKTTFAHRLVSELKYRAFQAEMVPELSRLCPFDINESGQVTKGQYWILKEQIRLEIEHGALLPDFLVCDRCVFDNSIFARRGAEKGYVDAATAALIDRTAELWQRSYFLLVYVAMEDHLRLSRNRGMDDGVRSSNEEFQVDIDRRIVEGLKNFPGSWMEVRGDLNRRLESTIDRLGRELSDARFANLSLPF